jgi:putative hydrolase of the HAD superfamily
VVETLEALRAAGYRLAILSNWDSRMPLLLRHLGLSRYFDVVLCSALEGVEKPHRDFFRKVQTAIGVPPRRTLHVGDLVREDYQGARAAGMQALWLDRRGESRPAGGEVEPSDVVTSIADVARLLEARRGPKAGGEA